MLAPLQLHSPLSHPNKHQNIPSLCGISTSQNEFTRRWTRSPLSKYREQSTNDNDCCLRSATPTALCSRVTLRDGGGNRHDVDRQGKIKNGAASTVCLSILFPDWEQAQYRVPPNPLTTDTRKQGLMISYAILKRILLSSFSIVICFALAEFVLRKIDIPSAQYSGWKSQERVRSQQELNQLGYRGQLISYNDDDYVVVLLGDSQVFAASCSYYRMPEKRLEYYLNKSAGKNVRVFTIGDSGYGQDQQLEAIEEYFKLYRADLTILWFTPDNDVVNNVFPTSNIGGGGIFKPTYKMNDGALKGPYFPWGEKVTHRFRIIQLLLNRLGIDQESLWYSSLPPAYKGEPFDLAIDSTDVRSPENLKEENTHHSMSLTPRSSRTAYGLQLTHLLIERIRNTVTAHGSDFAIFFTTASPDESSTGPASTLRQNGFTYKATAAQRNENISLVMSNMPCFMIPVTEYPFKVGPEDGHLCETAVDQVMHELSNAIREQCRSAPPVIGRPTRQNSEDQNQARADP